MATFPFPGPDLVFGASSSLAMLGWTALALSPARARWAGAARLFAGRVVPLLLAVVYGVLARLGGRRDEQGRKAGDAENEQRCTAHGGTSRKRTDGHQSAS